MTETTRIIPDGGAALDIRETVDGRPKEEMRRQSHSDSDPKATPVGVNKADKHIWAIYIILLIVSVVELYSASSREVVGENVYMPLLRHARFLVVGFIMVLAMQRIHYKWYRKSAKALAVITIILLVYVFFFGANINNAQRAIKLGGAMTIQPPEIAKLTCMLLLAAILAKHQMLGGVTTKGVIYAATSVVAFCALTFDSGLTNTIIIVGVSICMLIISGINWSKIGIVLLIYAVGAGGVMIMRHSGDNEQKVQEVIESGGVDRTEVHEGRLDAYLKGVNPTDSMHDGNRQAMMSRFAQAHGRLVGQGLGKSRETARLPLAFSDYIYAIIVEESGFIGGCLLLLLYLLLLARAGKIASQCSRAFPALLIMGCAVLIVFQALVHMAIVTGVAPVSGQPLPLISKGGTSVLVFSAAIGMMLSVSRFAVRTGGKKEITEELKELPEDIKSDNPSQIGPKDTH